MLPRPTRSGRALGNHRSKANAAPGFCWVQHQGQKYSSSGRASTISSSRTPQIGQQIGRVIGSVESGITQDWDTIRSPLSVLPATGVSASEDEGEAPARHHLPQNQPMRGSPRPFVDA